jgi:lipid-A-disaccharide synthase
MIPTGATKTFLSMRSAKGTSTILFIAGDMSGDIYTARLASSLAKDHPQMILHAIGGEQLGSAIKGTGGTWLADTTGYGTMGIYSTLPNYLLGKSAQKKMRSFVNENPIDLVVLCDWGGANCRQLSFFHKAGIPVLYYFPPGSYRRNGHPGRDIVRFATRVATPFRWSAERLVDAGCSAEWVGHPILESTQKESDREDLRQEFEVGPCEKLIALLPGSRISEIRVLAPRLAETARILSREPGMKFIVPIPESLKDEVNSFFPPSVRIVLNRTADALTASDAAVVKTGTATLEAAVIGTPQVAIYDFGWIGRIEWLLLWMWKKIPFIAMPNIILQRLAVEELLGLSCRAEAIAAALKKLLENDGPRKTLTFDYASIRKHLGEDLPRFATVRTVEIILEMLAEQPGDTLQKPRLVPCY